MGVADVSFGRLDRRTYRCGSTEINSLEKTMKPPVSALLVAAGLSMMAGAQETPKSRKIRESGPRDDELYRAFSSVAPRVHRPDAAMCADIAVHNAAVDLRKAEKKLRKLKRK